MTGTLLGLQALCVLVFALSFAMAQSSRRRVWLWAMGAAALGIVICAGLGFWGPLFGLGRPD